MNISSRIALLQDFPGGTWLELCTFTAGDMDSIPSQGIKKTLKGTQHSQKQTNKQKKAFFYHFSPFSYIFGSNHGMTSRHHLSSSMLYLFPPPCISIKNQIECFFNQLKMGMNIIKSYISEYYGIWKF